MNAFDYIVQILYALRRWTYDAAHACWDSNWVPNVVGDWIWDFYEQLATWIAKTNQLSGWYNYTVRKITTFLNIDEIRASLKTWLDAAQDAWNWVVNHFQNVVSDVATWWYAYNNPIRLFIEGIRSNLQTAISSLTTALTGFRQIWDTFWTSIWPQFLRELQVKWNEFSQALADLWQKVTVALSDFWNNKVWPGLKSIWQFLAELHIPTWEEIWNYIFSKIPWIGGLKNWWDETYYKLKDFWADPIGTVKSWLPWNWIADKVWEWIGEMLETEETIKDMEDKTPETIDVVAETISTLSTAETAAVEMQEGVIDETLAEIKRSWQR